MNIRLILSGLAASAALWMPGTARGQIFETNGLGDTIGEYTTSGATVNASLVSGLSRSPELTKPNEASRFRVSETYGKLPVSFEANDGQQDRPVRFLSRGSGYNLFLTDREAVLVLTKLHKPTSLTANSGVPAQERQSAILRTKLVSANPAVRVIGQEELPGKVNYFIGSDPTKWRTNVTTYAKVRYEQVYPGIDLVYYGNQRQLEYDFVVAPGADPTRIRLSISGAQNMHVDGRGEVVVQTAHGAVRWNKPSIYQQVGGMRRAVKGKYVLRRGHEISFQVAAYDAAKPLVIDPTLVYSTYLGGSYIDIGQGIAVDIAGNAYVTGYTGSTNFPTTAGAVQTTFNGGYDAFVTKLNPTGSSLLYSTYLGGSGNNYGLSIAVDTTGNAYVTGSTNASDFPTTAGAFQTTSNGGAFVTKLNPTGTGLVYSTFLSGSLGAGGAGIAVDAAGNAYVAGATRSTDFPTTVGAPQTTNNGSTDAFVTKLNPNGTGLLYSTYLGGSGEEGGQGIALDTAGNAYVTGATRSTNFPTTPGVFQGTNNDSENVFVTKLNPTGTSLLYSTYLGGSSEDVGYGIAVDIAGNAYVTGTATSTDFPTSAMYH